MKNKRKLLFDKQNGKCYYCERVSVIEARTNNDPLLFTVEHLQRRCEDGGNKSDNLVGACYRCNTHRDAVPHEVWKVICLEIFEHKRRQKHRKTKSKYRIKRLAATRGLGAMAKDALRIHREKVVLPLINKCYTDARDKIYAVYWPEGLVLLADECERGKQHKLANITNRDTHEMIIRYGDS